MLVFPNCKINLGLHVVRKRDDGYHDLDTVFYPIALNDAAEMIVCTASSDPGFELNLSGIDVPGNKEDNLCYKAWKLIRQDFPDIPSLKMYLHKAIPHGAGLGGGSSDAAATLQLLNEVLSLGISNEKLMQYALQLGSDCPFFLYNKPCSATRRGEKMEPLELNLNSCSFVLVHPGIHISTKEAFQILKIADLKTNALRPKDVVQQRPETWKESLVNDFEAPVFSKYPQLRKIKEVLYESGAIYASMTGTGSCVYGIFNKLPVPALEPVLDPSYKIYYVNRTV